MRSRCATTRDAIAGRICCYAERADHVIDGEPMERPISPWSTTA